MIKRAKERYERELSGPDESRHKSRSNTPQQSKLTRSQTSPLNKELCFFCDKPPAYREVLFNVRTLSAGESLCKAASLPGNEKLLVKLNSAIAANDAHSIDIKYHKNCWLKGVSNALRKPALAPDAPVRMASEIAAKVEFLTVADITLGNGNIIPISQLQSAYKGILSANNVDDKIITRKALKQLLQNEITNIEFQRPKRVNEPERVSVKTGHDKAIQKAEDQDSMIYIKILFDAAAIIRKSIKDCKKWVFTGSLDDITDENIPLEPFSFFRWVIQGPSDLLSSDEKSNEVQKRAMSLAQSTVAMCLSDRQVKHKNKKSETTRMTSEMPQQPAIGLAIHQAV